MHTMLQIMDIIPGTSVDGPGLRTAVYVAGCRHRCPGCHNPQTWNFDAGHPMSVEDVMAMIEDNGFNVTLTGGDPLYSIAQLMPLVRAIRNAGYTIWLYTGFTYDEALRLPRFTELLPYLEAVVEGPFIEALRDVSLHFRGSSNQRIIDVKSTVESNKIIEMDI